MVTSWFYFCGYVSVFIICIPGYRLMVFLWLYFSVYLLYAWLPVDGIFVVLFQSLFTVCLSTGWWYFCGYISVFIYCMLGYWLMVFLWLYFSVYLLYAWLPVSHQGENALLQLQSPSLGPYRTTTQHWNRKKGRHY